MNEEKTEREQQPVCEEEHVIHMWTPCRFTVTEDYDFFPDNVLFLGANALLRHIVFLLLPLVHRYVLGLKVRGRENLREIKGGAVTVCNHVNYLDCTMIACTFRKKRICYTTLEDNFKIPVVRHLIRALGAIPIPRNRRTYAAMNQALEEYVRNGGVVQFYPETVLRPYCRELRGFKRGAFLLAHRLNVPVVPFVITYRKPRGIFAVFKKKPCLNLTVLKPVYPDCKKDEREGSEWLKEEVYRRMKEAIQAATR